MKIVYPKRCPKCKQYNLTMETNPQSRRRRYFIACITPGCWYFGPGAWTKTKAIRKWNQEVSANENA